MKLRTYSFLFSFFFLFALVLAALPQTLYAQSDYQTGCGNDDLDDPGDGDSEDPEDPTDDRVGDPIDPHKGNVHRDVTDISTFGPAPIVFARNLNSRTTDFTDGYWEFGSKQAWQHNWNYEVRQLSTKTYGFFDIKVRYADGNDVNFKAIDSSGTQLGPQANNGDRLYRWTGSKVGYTLMRADGKEYDFWRYLSPKFHLTEVRNGVGSLWTCTYDANQQLSKITNNFGSWVQIDHESGPDGVSRINRVSTSDGRAVTYSYTSWVGTAKPVLSAVNYPGGEQAAYQYVTADPASATARPLLAQAFDPKGRGGAQMKYSYNYNALSYGNVITGTALENRSGVSDTLIAQMPIGSGNHPQIVAGNGGEISRRYVSGLLTEKIDAAGRGVTLARDAGGFGFVTSRTEIGTGAAISYGRDYAGRILSRSDALGNTSSSSYNAKGFLVTHTDELGRTATITRDTVNSRPIRIDYPDGGYETWTYNAKSQPATHQLRSGGTETFAYDSSGNLTTQTDALGNSTSYTYYPSGLVSSATDALLNTTSFTYNWRGQVLTVTHPDNTTIAYEYDLFGNRTGVTDELGHQTHYTYDEFNRLESTTDPLGRTTAYQYGQAPDSPSTAYMRKVSRVILPSGKKTEYTYDLAGRRLSQTVGAGTPEAATTRYRYDIAGNLISVTDPRGKISTFSYDARHQRTSATDPLGRTTQWSYDYRGNKISETRPDGGVTHFVYDNRNRLVRTTDPAGYVTANAYDAAGNLATVTDARNNIYRYTYDSRNRRIAMTYPDGSQEKFSYDRAGNLESYMNRAGQIRTANYDNRNREIAFAWSDGTPGAATDYDAASRVLAVNTSVSALSYAYDAAGQLLFETQDVVGAGGAKTINYSYDRDGNRLTAGYPSGDVISYGYSARNQLVEIDSRGNELATYAYDLNGNRIGRTLENGTAANYGYDDASRGFRVDQLNSAGSFAAVEYTFNSVGARTSRTETDSGATPFTDIYGYDAIDQLTRVRYNYDANTTTQERLVDYAYDGVGNRTSVTDNGITESYAVTSSNQYTTAGSMAPGYDGNGNLSGLSGASYVYDAQNRLVSASANGTTITFAYDGRNRCVKRTTNGTAVYLYYDAWNLIEEHSSSALLNRYVHGATVDEMLARFSVSGTAVYFHQDALGNTIALTDAGGNVVERYKYDVFGAASFFDAAGSALSSSSYDNRFLFTGREYFQALGVYDYRNRFYAPALGRFLQNDPLRFGAGDVNLYRYAGNRATTATDPSGLYTTDDSGLFPYPADPGSEEGDGGCDGGSGDTDPGGSDPDAGDDDGDSSGAGPSKPGDDTSPWKLGLEWLTGRGDRTHNFGDGDPMTELLQQHSHIQDTRELIADSIANGGPYEGSNDYNLGGLQGVAKYLRDYSTLLTGGLTGNLAVTYLGSYHLDYSVTSVSNDGSATVNFHVTNTSSIESATHPPVVGYTEWWHNNIGQPLSTHFSSGPMSPTTQTFDWTETIHSSPHR
jgi:RHS repeat-associated protein